MSGIETTITPCCLRLKPYHTSTDKCFGAAVSGERAICHTNIRLMYPAYMLKVITPFTERVLIPVTSLISLTVKAVLDPCSERKIFSVYPLYVGVSCR